MYHWGPLIREVTEFYCHVTLVTVKGEVINNVRIQVEAMMVS